jgi:hypothetical protein
VPTFLKAFITPLKPPNLFLILFTNANAFLLAAKASRRALAANQRAFLRAAAAIRCALLLAAKASRRAFLRIAAAIRRACSRARLNVRFIAFQNRRFLSWWRLSWSSAVFKAKVLATAFSSFREVTSDKARRFRLTKASLSRLFASLCNLFARLKSPTISGGLIPRAVKPVRTNKNQTKLVIF